MIRSIWLLTRVIVASFCRAVADTLDPPYEAGAGELPAAEYFGQYFDPGPPEPLHWPNDLAAGLTDHAPPLTPEQRDNLENLRDRYAPDRQTKRMGLGQLHAETGHDIGLTSAAEMFPQHRKRADDAE